LSAEREHINAERERLKAERESLQGGILDAQKENQRLRRELAGLGRKHTTFDAAPSGDR
jgi:hypothetical protein